MTTTTITELTIGEYLKLRVRLAEVQVDAHMRDVAAAAVEHAFAKRQADATPSLDTERLLAATTAGLRAAEARYSVADCGLAKAERELKALAGEAPALPFVPAPNWEIKRLAGLLFVEAETMDAEQAVELVLRAEDLRGRHHYATYIAPHEA